MRDYTYPVAAGMLIAGAGLMLIAATAAHAESTTPPALHASSVLQTSAQASSAGARIRTLIRQEADLQMEVQRATALHHRARQSADPSQQPDPGCVICKID